MGLSGSARSTPLHITIQVWHYEMQSAMSSATQSNR